MKKSVASKKCVHIILDDIIIKCFTLDYECLELKVLKVLQAISKYSFPKFRNIDH